MQSLFVETTKTPDDVHDKLRALYDTLSIAADQTTLIVDFFQKITEILGASKALFFLAKGKEGGILLKPFANKSMKTSRGIFLSRKDPLYTRFQVSKRPLLANEIGTGEVARSVVLRSLPAHAKIETVLFLHTGDKLRGVILLGNGQQPIRWSEAESGLLQKIARQAGKLIEQWSLHNKIRRVAKEKSVLLEVGKKISASLDLRKVLNAIIDSLNTVVPYDAAVIFLINDRTGEIEHQVFRGYHQGHLESIHLKVGQGLSGWVAKQGKPVLVPDVRKDDRYVRSNPHTRSEMAVPLIRGHEVIGAFNVESNRLNAYTRHDLELLQAFANQATISIENARLYEEALQKREVYQELRVARDIQRALLPKSMPAVKGFSFAALNMPSRQVGGDFYDITQLSGGTIALAVGDVSGKGTPGAILMGNLSATYRGQIRREFPPAQLMERVNKLFKENIAEEHFATFFHGRLDPEQRVLEYCNAGHNPPALVRADGSVEFLKEGGLILGFLSGVEYNQGLVKLSSGDVLVLYTDGITEAENEREELFGVERLTEVVRSYGHLRANDLKCRLLEEIKSFTRGTPLPDDVTLLIIKAL